jgi:MFS family permease
MTSVDLIVKPQAAPARAGISGAYRTYALVLLLSVMTLNFVDRQIVNILAEPIKTELQLADWQLGMATGLAFALLYTVLGVPLARLSERRDRSVIISVSLGVWSLMTVLCGMATSFGQFVLARVGVGIGEAGCTPAAHSLISDYVPLGQRASAMAIYNMGIPLGGLIGMAMGGLVADAYGWRTAFMIAGVPGMALLVVTLLTLPEPRRALQGRMALQSRGQSSFSETLRYLAARRTYWLLCLAGGSKLFVSSGQGPFLASFFYRQHGPALTALAGHLGLKAGGFMGVALGLLLGIGGLVGLLIGGLFADHYGRRDLRAFVSLPALAAMLTVPASICVFTVTDVRLALALVVLPALLGSVWNGPVNAAIQSIAPSGMRATASAISLFIVNVLGNVIAPVLIGALSDLFAKRYGLGSAGGLQLALVVSSFGSIVTLVLFLMSRRWIRQDIAHTEGLARGQA